MPGRLPKALTEEEVGRLLDAPVATGPAGRRDRALLELLYGTGARISEAVGLDLADLAGDEGLVRLYGKGSKERLVPLGRCAAAALGEWLAPAGRSAFEPERWRRRGDAEALFLNTRGGRLSRQGAYGIVRARARAAGTGRPGQPPRAAPLRAPPTCWPGVPTSAPSRSSSATSRSPPPSSTPRSLPSTCGRPTSPPTLGPDPPASLRHRRRRLGRMAHDARATEQVAPDCRELLGARARPLRAQLADLGFGDADGLIYDANFADSSQVTAERGEAETLAGELKEQLAEVEAAIGRLAEGTYGRCERCGEPISPARLEAMPAARRCIACASRPDDEPGRGARRPVGAVVADDPRRPPAPVAALRRGRPGRRGGALDRQRG